MIPYEHWLGDKADAERVADAVTDFTRQRQQVAGSATVENCQCQSVFARNGGAVVAITPREAGVLD